MDDRHFEVHVDPSPGAIRLRMQGDLDGRADDALRTAYGGLAALGDAPLTLDFHAVGYINSTGIALIVRLLAEARRDGRTVRAEGLTAHYQEIFRITRLSDFMEIVEGAAA